MPSKSDLDILLSSVLPDTNEIEHSGVKGMRWGQRKQEIMSTRAYKIREQELEARATRIANEHLKKMNEKIAAREAEKKKKEAERAAEKKKKDAEKKAATKKATAKSSTKSSTKSSRKSSTRKTTRAASSKKKKETVTTTAKIKYLPKSSGSSSSKTKISAPSRTSTAALRLKHSTTSGATNSADELLHYGILGMKWGIRRDQRTLDRLAGRPVSAEREEPSARQLARSERKDAKKAAALVKNARKADVKVRRSLSDSDLKSRVERLKLENEYRRLSAEDLSPGSSLMKTVLKDAGKKALTKQTERFLSTLIEKSIADPALRAILKDASRKTLGQAKREAKKKAAFDAKTSLAAKEAKERVIAKDKARKLRAAKKKAERERKREEKKAEREKEQEEKEKDEE